MLVAVDYLGNQVVAWRTGEEEYFCPECEEAVFLKDGPEKITHFSHYPSSSCGYGTGEGVRHQQMKIAVMQAFELHEGVRFEQSVIPGRRADVVVPHERIVVECQVSPMKRYEWFKRTYEYSEAGYSVLWVWDEKRFSGEYTPEELLLCHRICYGQLTMYSIEDEQWYSVHLEWYPGAGKRRRSQLCKEIPESADLLRKFNDGLRVVNLMRPWWTKGRVKS